MPIAGGGGRRSALILSVTMMCGGSLMIALTPTGLGSVSPLLLIIARLLQGFAVGGEYGASATYVSEMASAAHRGFWSGVLYVTLIGGQLAAMALLVVLQYVLGDEALYAWGWRVPFVIGAALAVVVFWIRRGIEETRPFSNTTVEIHARGRPLALLVEYPRQTAIVLGLTAAGAIGFYTCAVYMQKLLVNTVGLERAVVSALMTKVLATLLFFPPRLGWVADYVGHKRTLLVAFAASAVLAVPVLSTIARTTDPFKVYLLCLLPLFFLSGYYALSATIKAELYPAHVRAIGVSLPYAVALAIFGGNAETAALYFKTIGMEAGYYWLVSAIFVVGFIAAACLPGPVRGDRSSGIAAPVQRATHAQE